MCYLVKTPGTEFCFIPVLLHYLHHYLHLFIGVVMLILFDVNILHFNMLKGGIFGFEWTFLVFTDVTKYEHFFVQMRKSE